MPDTLPDVGAVVYLRLKIGRIDIDAPTAGEAVCQPIDKDGRDIDGSPWYYVPRELLIPLGATIEEFKAWRERA